MTPVHSGDVSDDFLEQLVAACAPSGLACDPCDFIGCWVSESGLTPAAQNKGALASGFFQAMPKILRGMGFRGDGHYQEAAGAYSEASNELSQAHADNNAAAIAAAQTKERALDVALANAFCRLTLEGQLTWAIHFYKPHAGKFVNAAACYACNFVPAWMGHAADPDWVICAKDGRNDARALTPAQSQEWYRENAALDVDGDGKITMGDLAARAAKCASSPRGDELVARIGALRAHDSVPPTQPEPVGVVAELAAIAAEPPPLDDV